MLQVARVAPKVLGDSADLVRDFFLRQQHADGGFVDRAGRSDLYYTVFGIEGLLALQQALPVDQLEAYFANFGTGETLDFVHLCCLARCRSALAGQRPLNVPVGWTENVAGRIESFRSADGGYNVLPGSAAGTAYGNFLAVAAYQDLRLPMPNPLRVVQSLKFLETPDGAWANERAVKLGATNSTAAAMTLLRHLQLPVTQETGAWLMRQLHKDGGFLAVPSAPIPDLLSTATALHALSGVEYDLDPIRERCLDFTDTLWSNEGGFHGHWSDDSLDCEYTYYGLLALGHLSL